MDLFDEAMQSLILNGFRTLLHSVSIVKFRFFVSQRRHDGLGPRKR